MMYTTEVVQYTEAAWLRRARYTVYVIRFQSYSIMKSVCSTLDSACKHRLSWTRNEGTLDIYLVRYITPHIENTIDHMRQTAHGLRHAVSWLHMRYTINTILWARSGLPTIVYWLWYTMCYVLCNVTLYCTQYIVARPTVYHILPTMCSIHNARNLTVYNRRTRCVYVLCVVRPTVHWIGPLCIRSDTKDHMHCTIGVVRLTTYGIPQTISCDFKNTRYTDGTETENTDDLLFTLYDM